MRSDPIKTIFATMILIAASCGSAIAVTPATDDGFGNTYFTARSSSAFNDAGNDATAAAEALNRIEPTAGGDNVSASRIDAKPFDQLSPPDDDDWNLDNVE